MKNFTNFNLTATRAAARKFLAEAENHGFAGYEDIVLMFAAHLLAKREGPKHLVLRAYSSGLLLEDGKTIGSTFTVNLGTPVKGGGWTDLKTYSYVELTAEDFQAASALLSAASR